MERKYPGFTNDASKADVLRRAVDESPDDRARLAALLTLARHYVDVADGVNGFATAKLARSLALQLKDFVSAAHALNSVSVSQYHRSEYVSAIATALDAWDYATRSRSAVETADSYFSMAFSLFGLGALDTAEQVVAKGLASVSGSAQFLEPRIRLLRLRGILFQARGSMDEAERAFVEAMEVAQGSTGTQLAACYAMWAIGWLRTMDEQYGGRPVIPEKLREARAYLEKALALAEADGDIFLATDRIGLLGVVALLERRWEQAEELLGHALDRARSLDYVRTFVVSAVYLGRLYLEREDPARAATVLRHAVTQARRGAADDVLGYARSLLATALERVGSGEEAAKERAAAAALRREVSEDRRRALEEALRLVARIVEPG